jgi:hypothetical protein
MALLTLLVIPQIEPILPGTCLTRVREKHMRSSNLCVGITS